MQAFEGFRTASGRASCEGLVYNNSSELAQEI